MINNVCAFAKQVNVLRFAKCTSWLSPSIFCEMRQAQYELIGHMTHINLLHRHAMADKFFDSLKLAG